MYLLLFANYFLGGPEVLDLQFRNAQKEPNTMCLRKKGPPWNSLEVCHPGWSDKYQQTKCQQCTCNNSNI